MVAPRCGIGSGTSLEPGCSQRLAHEFARASVRVECRARAAFDLSAHGGALRRRVLEWVVLDVDCPRLGLGQLANLLADSTSSSPRLERATLSISQGAGRGRRCHCRCGRRRRCSAGVGRVRAESALGAVEIAPVDTRRGVGHEPGVRDASLAEIAADILDVESVRLTLRVCGTNDGAVSETVLVDVLGAWEAVGVLGGDLSLLATA